MKLVWSPEAIDDLIQTRQYIAQDDPAAADRLVQSIVTTVEERLTYFPESGRLGRLFGTRELVISRTPFIVPYRTRGDRIEILRVYHAARRWPDQL